MSHYKEFSIHFDADKQNIDALRIKFYDWCDKNQGILPLTEGPTGFIDRDITMHHCFLPRMISEELGISTEALNFIEEFVEEYIMWYNASEDGIDDCQRLMFINLKKLGGAAFFLGKLEGELLEEYRLAKMYLGTNVYNILID